MKVIKEDMQNLDTVLDGANINDFGHMPITMIDAIKKSKKRKELIDKEMEEYNKETEVKLNKVVGAEKQPVPDVPKVPKSMLEESLFEDYDQKKETWCDQKYDELMDKGKRNWDEDDWDAYHYIMQTWSDYGYFDEELNETRGRKKEPIDLFDAIYIELSTDAAHEDSKRKISRKEFKNSDRFRFDSEIGFDMNDGPNRYLDLDVRNAKVVDNKFILECRDEKQLEFAKKVADIYGVDFENDGLHATITIPWDML